MVAITVLGAALLFVASPQAKAVIVGFEGPYAPANWTLTTNGGDGSVVTLGAPTSITLIGNNNDVGANTDFTTLAVGDGLVSFSWNYETFDNGGPGWDPFGYLLGGVFTQLTDDSGAQTQSGTASFSVLAGQTFGFRVNSVDGTFGPAQSIISSFEVGSAAVPEPGTWAAAALLAGGAAFMRRRKRHRSGGDDLEGSQGQERTPLTGTRLAR
jgi:hypothetical protein